MLYSALEDSWYEPVREQSLTTSFSNMVFHLIGICCENSLKTYIVHAMHLSAYLLFFSLSLCRRRPFFLYALSSEPFGYPGGTHTLFSCLGGCLSNLKSQE